jgi:hypothetical protein
LVLLLLVSHQSGASRLRSFRMTPARLEPKLPAGPSLIRCVAFHKLV